MEFIIAILLFLVLLSVAPDLAETVIVSVGIVLELTLWLVLVFATTLFVAGLLA